MECPVPLRQLAERNGAYLFLHNYQKHKTKHFSDAYESLPAMAGVLAWFQNAGLFPIGFKHAF